jgi:hypothetical protein
MFIDEFAEMGCPSRDQDSMYFEQDGFPGDCDGGLHVSDVYEIEGVGFEGEGFVYNVVKLDSHVRIKHKKNGKEIADKGR